MRRRFGRYLWSFVVVAFLCGCGPYPPSVATKVDIEALPLATRSVHARSLGDADVAALAQLRQMETLNFASGHARNDVTTGFKNWEAAITDRGLSTLAELKLPKLKNLDLGYCDRITDAGLRHVAKIDSVTSLSLRGNSQITDSALNDLVAMKGLTALDLRECAGITDRGLQALGEKSNWELIRLGGCQGVTAEGIAELTKALPNARVNLQVE